MSFNDVRYFTSDIFPKAFFLMAFSKNIFPTATWEVAAWENDFGKVPKDFLTGLGEILKWV